MVCNKCIKGFPAYQDEETRTLSQCSAASGERDDEEEGADGNEDDGRRLEQRRVVEGIVNGLILPRETAHYVHHRALVQFNEDADAQQRRTADL